MSSSLPEVDDPDDLSALATEQRRELMAAMTIESDLDFAFQLQLQEAINASLSLEPSTSSTPTLPTQLPPMEVKDAHLSDKDVSVTLPGIQSEEILKFEQEMKDRSISEAEFRKLRDDLHRRLHDQKLAEEIERMPEDEWEEFGDNYESPFGEGSSKSLSNEIFRVYFKGLVETEEEVAVDRNKKGGLRGQIFGGIGVAISDSRDELLFELRKPLFGDGMSKQIAGIKALIEGLNAAFSLELERIVFYCDQFPIYQFATGKWTPKQRKIAALMKEVTLLREKFAYCQPFFVARNDIKFAFKLAREAILSQINRPTESSVARNPYETCAICLEDTDANKIFSIDDCMHRYCYSCMKQHVEAKLLHGMLPKCPHESCNSELRVDSCSKFLTPKLVEIMKQRIKESSIPVTEKVYCPNPKCSALMSKSEALEYSKSVLVGVEIFGRGICKECNSRFCVHCKVPWHYNMTCSGYKRRFPNPPAEDMKLKTLAARNLWRQCIKCNHMIELAAGCYHMTCRCGYEFCYTCGSEWKNKKATCSCPLWDEDFIMDEDEDEDEEEDEDEDVDEEFDAEDYESSSEYLFFVN